MVAIPVAKQLSLRAGAGYLSVSMSPELNSLVYDMDIGMRWFPVLMDLSPGGGAFRFSGGVLFNGGAANASYVPTLAVELGANTYTPEQLGSVEGEIRVEPVSPYLGIGIGNPAGDGPGMRVLLDAGVAFTSYEVSFGHVGGSLPHELADQLERDLALEADSLQQTLNAYRVYPVISAGVLFGW